MEPAPRQLKLDSLPEGLHPLFLAAHTQAQYLEFLNGMQELACLDFTNPHDKESRVTEQTKFLSNNLSIRAGLTEKGKSLSPKEALPFEIEYTMASMAVLEKALLYNFKSDDPTEQSIIELTCRTVTVNIINNILQKHGVKQQGISFTDNDGISYSGTWGPDKFFSDRGNRKFEDFNRFRMTVLDIIVQIEDTAEDCAPRNKTFAKYLALIGLIFLFRLIKIHKLKINAPVSYASHLIAFIIPQYLDLFASFQFQEGEQQC